MTTSGERIGVTVVNGDEVLETVLLRTLRLPGGGAGALWRGLVFPLDGNRVDVAGPSFPPGDCGPWTEEAPAGAAYALVEEAEEAYVLVAGGVIERDAAASRLRAAGVTVLRTGPYLGELPDGVDADWFVRVLRPAATPSLGPLVAEILGSGMAQEALRTTRQMPLHVDLLRRELADARAREAALRAELAQMRVAAAERSGSSAELTALEEALLEEQKRRALAEAEASARAEPRPALPKGRLLEEIQTVLKALLPRITPLRDTLRVIEAEYADRRAVYQAWSELQDEATLLAARWKRVRGAQGWWERHLSNGQDDAGRAYARRAPGTSQWEVLISHKQEQARDIAWLARHGGR